MACSVLRSSEKLAIVLLTFSLLQLVASAAVFYFGLALQIFLEVDLLAMASIEYKLLPLVLIGLGAASTFNK